MSPRDVTGEYAVRNCGEANIEWNYNTRRSDNFLRFPSLPFTSLLYYNSSMCTLHFEVSSE
jgi:hypothetical protein